MGVTSLMHYSSDVLTEEQLAFLARRLPVPRAYTGRPAYDNLTLLPGILKVLRTGCRWRDLNQIDQPEGTTHWRRLRFWKRIRRFRTLWELLLDELYQQRKLDTRLLILDGTLIPSFDFRERVSFSGKHKSLGVKASIIVDGTGIPLGVTIAPGSWNDMRLAVNTIEDMRLEISLSGSFLLADKGYDSFEFRKYLDSKGLRSNIPKRSTTLGLEKELYNCDPKIYKFRFIIERTNAWFKSFKRLRFRYDRSSCSFEAFLSMAIIVMCVRRLLP